MASRRSRKTQSIALKSMEIAIAAPQVVAHRVTRMALSGNKLSDRDRREFQLMLQEKHAAFGQAWSGMALHTFRANQALIASLMRSLVSPFSRGTPSVAAASLQFQNAALGAWGKGLAPIHRKAVSNARRLAKIKVR